MEEQSAEEVPDREAMTVLGAPDVDSLLLPFEGSIQGAILDQVTAQLPPEAAGIDLHAVANSTLTGEGPLEALPPELVPETTVISENETIAGDTLAPDTAETQPAEPSA
jgi:hypothetical protein